MTRLQVGIAGVLVALACVAPATAAAAWSTQQQVKGFLSDGRPAIAVEETGAIDLGISTGATGGGPSGTGAYYLHRPTSATGWSLAEGTSVTKITGATNTANWALSSSGAAVVTWSTGSAFASTPFAAYKAPGKAWSAAEQLDGPTGYGAPTPVIDEAGHAAVVWTRKSTGSSYLLNMPNQIVYSAPGATTWTAPSKIADITVPDPHDQTPGDGIDYNRCGDQLHVAILPGGTPVVSWDDDYGSYKQSGGVNDGYEIGLCSVRTAAAGGAPVNVTPRPATGFYVSPAANMPSWTQTSLVASPTDADTAILLRGREDSLKFTGCAEVDACADQERDTRAAVGSGATLGMGTSIGVKEIATVALRNGRTLLVADGPSSVLRAGVGTGVPSLTPLAEDFQMISAGLSLNDAGAAHVGVVPNNTTSFTLRAFDAPAAGAFSAPTVLDTAVRTPSLGLDCAGLPVIVWARTSNQIFSSNFDAAPGVCGDGPDPEPENPTPNPGGGGGGATPPGAVINTPPPVPSSLATIGPPKTDGSKVSFTITCSPLTVNACGGKTVITQSNGGGKARAAARSAGTKIGSLSFSGLKPGAKKTLKVPLVASAKQALNAGKSLRVTITATVRDGAGNVRVTTKKATLKK
ncbi:MAG TPA: hypothetical protein VHR18_10820 [Solirubrobacterales bacterium]|nr:hypothetical protein [Solirubrobacterales bacterium]